MTMNTLSVLYSAMTYVHSYYPGWFYILFLGEGWFSAEYCGCGHSGCKHGNAGQSHLSMIRLFITWLSAVCVVVPAWKRWADPSIYNTTMHL